MDNVLRLEFFYLTCKKLLFKKKVDSNSPKKINDR